MQIDFTCSICAEDGTWYLPDVECELDVQVRLVSSQPEIEIEGVRINGVDLWEEGPLAKLLAGEITRLADQDEDFCTRAVEASGYSFSGLNGNDPGGRWSRPKAAE